MHNFLVHDYPYPCLNVFFSAVSKVLYNLIGCLAAEKLETRRLLSEQSTTILVLRPRVRELVRTMEQIRVSWLSA